jgi:hypothetical protein
MTVPLKNDSVLRQVYSVVVDDPDKHLLVEEEVSFVHGAQELAHWVKQGKVSRPESYDCITSKDTIILNPGQKIDLLFKMRTYREVLSDVAEESSAAKVKQRFVKITIKSSDAAPLSIECCLIPLQTPVDHTFRFYEPENSHFNLRIPPLI